MFSPQSTQDDATVLLPNGLGNRLPVVPKLGLRRRARRQLVPRNAARAPEGRGDSLCHRERVHPQWTARARRPGATLTRLRPRYPEHNPCDNVFSNLMGKHVYLGSSTSRPRPESCERSRQHYHSDTRSHVVKSYAGSAKVLLGHVKPEPRAGFDVNTCRSLAHSIIAGKGNEPGAPWSESCRRSQ